MGVKVTKSCSTQARMTERWCESEIGNSIKNGHVERRGLGLSEVVLFLQYSPNFAQPRNTETADHRRSLQLAERFGSARVRLAIPVLARDWTVTWFKKSPYNGSWITAVQQNGDRFCTCDVTWKRSIPIPDVSLPNIKLPISIPTVAKLGWVPVLPVLTHMEGSGDHFYLEF